MKRGEVLRFMAYVLTLMALLAAGGPQAPAPLTPAQRDALATAVDGPADHVLAFDALLDNVRLWQLTDEVQATVPKATGSTIDRLLADSASHRGELIELSGRIEQLADLPHPHPDVVEWFVRPDEGPPMMVYVDRATMDRTWRVGQAVTIPARFYKRIDLRARDGAIRGYAAFVGGHPRSATASSPTSSGGAAPSAWAGPRGAIVALVVLLGVFVLLLAYVKRGGHAARAVRVRSASDESIPGVDDAAGLPDDPVEALAELRRRAASGPR